ncbi:MAG: hypothetical protein U9O94_04395 [Nanoarchaeota archaeon]|nr:hypothetical protein [Nanoarchaeota archaeon]
MKKRINSKKKGNQWENKVANWLSDHGFKASKDGASGGGSREKGDIVNSMDMTIESKAYKTISLMKWWKQVVSSADKHNNTPVLFIHQDGMPDNNWLVVMNSDEWIELVKDSKAIKPVSEVNVDSNKLKWKLATAQRAVKELIKEIEI